MKCSEIIGEGVLPRASYWITATGDLIRSPRPENLWHADEAEKHFPGSRDPLGAALQSGWIRSNGAGHYLDLQFNFFEVSPAAIRAAILLVREVDDPDINYNIEGDTGQDTRTFSSPRSAIRFLNQCARNAK
jgi:hypothetical protein